MTIKKEYWKYGRNHILQDKFSVKEMEEIILYEIKQAQFKTYFLTCLFTIILMFLLFYFSTSYKFGFICVCDNIQVFNMTANEIIKTTL